MAISCVNYDCWSLRNYEKFASELRSQREFGLYRIPARGYMYGQKKFKIQNLFVNLPTKNTQKSTKIPFYIYCKAFLMEPEKRIANTVKGNAVHIVYKGSHEPP